MDGHFTVFICLDIISVDGILEHLVCFLREEINQWKSLLTLQGSLTSFSWSSRTEI